jgi:hypothetical protein
MLYSEHGGSTGFAETLVPIASQRNIFFKVTTERTLRILFLLKVAMFIKT